MPRTVPSRCAIFPAMPTSAQRTAPSPSPEAAATCASTRENGPISINLEGTDLERNRPDRRCAEWSSDAFRSVRLQVQLQRGIAQLFADELPRQHLRQCAKNLGRQQSPHRIRQLSCDDPALDRERPGFDPIVARRNVTLPCYSGRSRGFVTRPALSSIPIASARMDALYPLRIRFRA